MITDACLRIANGHFQINYMTSKIISVGLQSMKRVLNLQEIPVRITAVFIPILK